MLCVLRVYTHSLIFRATLPRARAVTAAVGMSRIRSAGDSNTRVCYSPRGAELIVGLVSAESERTRQARYAYMFARRPPRAATTVRAGGVRGVRIACTLAPMAPCIPRPP